MNEWWAFFLFALWGAGLALSARARWIRYKNYQKERWIVCGVWERGIMGIALLLAALRNAPHPLFDFDRLRVAILVAWLIAFVPLWLGVFFDYQSLGWLKYGKGRK